MPDTSSAIAAGGSMLSTAVSVGSSLFDNIFNAGQIKKNNEAQMNFANTQYDKQRQDALTDVATQNAYNSPAAQMQRLKAAGLNPNLVYGNGAAQSVSASPRPSSVPSYNPTPVHVNTAAIGAAPGAALSQYTDLKFRQAQTDNLTTATDVAKQDILLKAAQTASTVASTERTGVGTEADAFNLHMAKQLQSTSLEQAAANLAKTQTDIGYTQHQDSRQDALTANTLAQGAQDILSKKLGRSLTQEQIQNLQSDNSLKQLDINLKKAGIQPGDPIYARVATQIFNAVDWKAAAAKMSNYVQKHPMAQDILTQLSTGLIP